MLIEIYTNAGLNQEEIAEMPYCLDGDLDFFETSAYEKLYEYFAFETCEMPYGVAKARTETPDEWILQYLERYA